MVRRAVEIYLGLAYAGYSSSSNEALLDEISSADAESVFDLFEREASETISDSPLQRYTMRLGCARYPFMKLVLQEHIVRGEFYFVIDTHDHMEIKPGYPDYEAWVKIKHDNQELRRAIEAAFADAGLPTIDTVQKTVEMLPVPDRGDSGRSELILVVDDNEAEARTLEHVLRIRGYEVVRAGNGVEAIERLRSVRPALIVLDYEMPEMDGLTLIRELRSQEATRDLPLLLATAAKVVEADKKRADAFLHKPFESKQLIAKVEKLLGRS